MLTAEPPDLERRAVIVMMRIRPETSADLAGLPYQFTTFECALHGEMGPVFFRVLQSPVSLPRIGCQVQLRHDLHSRSGQHSRSDDVVTSYPGPKYGSGLIIAARNDHLAQPAMARCIVVRTVPNHRNRHLGQINRGRTDCKSHIVRKETSKSRMHGGDDRGPHQYKRYGGKTGRCQTDMPFTTDFAERNIHHPVRTLNRACQHMW